MIHAIYDYTKIQFIPNTHECNSAFAADAYSRLCGFGAVMVTSGPGVTNTITGIASSFYDSVPLIVLSGQVTTKRLGKQYGVKFYGFQETPIVEMVKPITKAAIELAKASDLMETLKELIAIAKHGRKGPVLLSVPDDLQRAEI
jgi:acetolactate synthase-1/2/3 large subunit